MNVPPGFRVACFAARCELVGGIGMKYTATYCDEDGGEDRTETIEADSLSDAACQAEELSAPGYQLYMVAWENWDLR